MDEEPEDDGSTALISHVEAAEDIVADQLERLSTIEEKVKVLSKDVEVDDAEEIASPLKVETTSAASTPVVTVEVVVVGLQ